LCCLLNILIKDFHTWHATCLLLNFLEYARVLITILKIILYRNSLGAFVFYTVLNLYSWYKFLMFFDAKGNISCLMIFSFYMYSLSYITMAWSWAKLGVETIRCLINIFMKVCWLWLDFFSFRNLWLVRQTGCSI
jgi:hypothetical protein